MRVKLLLGALLVCGLLTVPASACGGSGLFGGGGLFNGNGLFNGGGCNVLSRLRSRRSNLMARRVSRLSARVVRVGERSVLINGKRPCAAGKCNEPEVASAPEIDDGTMLEVHSLGILSDIANLDVGVLGSGSLLDINCGLLGGKGLSFHIPRVGSILSGLNLGGTSNLNGAGVESKDDDLEEAPEAS